jgi:zinc/manganese transport system ATP-binding protein
VIGTPEEVITTDQLGALYGIPIEVLHDRAGRLFIVGQSDVPAMHVDGARR